MAITNAVTDEQLKDLYDHLTLLYGQVAKAAPKALIVVTGYPYLFDSDPENPNPIVTALNEATAALNQPSRLLSRTRMTTTVSTSSTLT